MKSLGSIAEDLILQDIDAITEGKKPSPNINAMSSNEDPSIPDLSKVEVSSDFISSISEGRTPAVSVEEPQSIEAPQPTEDRLEKLIGELSTLLKEAKSLLVEMTGVGAIGVNMAGGENQEEEEKPKKKSKKKSKKKLDIPPTCLDIDEQTNHLVEAYINNIKNRKRCGSN